MELKLFNTLGKKKTIIKLKKKEIKIYLCGPTVYDNIHIGNLRSIFIFDIINRTLNKLKIKKKYVQNITDIDDKIILKAKKLKKKEKEISEIYTKKYFDNLLRYNVLIPDYFPKVTSNIEEIKKFIEKITKKKKTYYTNEELVFNIQKESKYGELSGQNLKMLFFSKEKIKNKKNYKDFSLWKKTKLGINWDSQWGRGRPGWHTECATFIKKIFDNKTIDIHGGGNDLIFPHHENERIQYLSINKKREISKIWLHVSHVKYNKEKMSKSLGNIIDAKKFYKNFGSNVLRYIFFNTHYKQVININEELIKQNCLYIDKISSFLNKLKFFLYDNNIFFEKNTSNNKEIINEILNNINTTKIIYLLQKIIKKLNKLINEKKINKKEIIKNIKDLNLIFYILGFKFDLEEYNFSDKLLIKKWKKLKKEKKYVKSDEIREELKSKKIL